MPLWMDGADPVRVELAEHGGQRRAVHGREEVVPEASPDLEEVGLVVVATSLELESRSELRRFSLLRDGDEVAERVGGGVEPRSRPVTHGLPALPERVP